MSELAESASLTGFGENSVILTDRVEGSGSIVRVVRRGTGTDEDVQDVAITLTLADVGVSSEGRRAHPVGVVGPEDPRSRSRVIINVEHVAN